MLAHTSATNHEPANERMFGYLPNGCTMRFESTLNSSAAAFGDKIGGSDGTSNRFSAERW